MARHSPDLFKNRSATQEFLYSHADEIIDDGNSQQALAVRDRAATAPLQAHFSDMLDRQGLARAIDTQMASVPTLCALAVKIGWTAGKKTDEEKATDIPEEAVICVSTVCRTHSGVWARIGRDRFACLFPHRTAEDGQELAHHLLKTFPDAPSLPITIGVSAYPTIDYTRSQIVENAEKALEHAGFLGPGSIAGFDAVSLNISGDRHYQTGDITGAIGEFKKGLMIDPADINLHNSLGVCFGVVKEYDNALTAFDNAIGLDPQAVMPTYNKGYILLLKGQREQALECFLKADAREPDVFEVVFHIGQMFMETGAAEKARPYLGAATRANSRSGPAFKSLGACLDKLALTKEAIQAYKSAVKINPADAESLSSLGRLYTRRGESLDVASVLCEQSVRLFPNNASFRHHLGRAYLNQGKLDQALAEFELALALGHDSQPQIAETQTRLMAAKAS